MIVVSFHGQEDFDWIDTTCMSYDQPCTPAQKAEVWARFVAENLASEQAGASFQAQQNANTDRLNVEAAKAQHEAEAAVKALSPSQPVVQTAPPVNYQNLIFIGVAVIAILGLSLIIFGGRNNGMDTKRKRISHR